MAVRVAALKLPVVSVVVDAAFDWGAKPAPLRRPDTDLDAMKLTIPIDTNSSSREGESVDNDRWPTKPLAARDGFGNIVDWFLVLKTPQGTFPAEQVTEILAKYGTLGVNSLNISRDKHCGCVDPKALRLCQHFGRHRPWLWLVLSVCRLE